MNYDKNELNISICSYNIFWKIMKNDSSPLVAKLGKNKLYELKLNILKNIYNIKNYYNPYFFCFQEAENHHEITDLFDKSEYKFHINYSNPEHMLTIWQHKLFKKKISIDGEFEKGRPFCIFIFKDLRFSNYFILVNIHPGHNSNTLDSIFKPIQNSIDNNIKIIKKYNIIRICICGDFNRDIKSQILMEPQKFNIKINQLVFFFFPNINNNKTCCNIEGYGYNKNYDQVIDSHNEPLITYQLNRESWYLAKSSDHLAILSIIKNFI